MAEEYETIKRLHEEWMIEHRQAIRGANRRLVWYLAYCSIVTLSSLILLLRPPIGLVPPADFRFSGEMIFLMILFGGTMLALFGLLAWLEYMMGRQAQRAAELIKSSFELGQRIGRAGMPNP